MVKLSMCLIKHHAMKTYWGVEVKFQAFLTSSLVEGEWSASRTGRFAIGQEAGWAPEPVWTRWRRDKFPSWCQSVYH